MPPKRKVTKAFVYLQVFETLLQLFIFAIENKFE
jgi:hypothetical protein